MIQSKLNSDLEPKLTALASALVDQTRARILIPAEAPERGYWFGGGNMISGSDGRLYLCGRYRSSGDSRTGLDLGDRGRELAIFASSDGGQAWSKIVALGKKDLAPEGMIVLSIEGSALRATGSGFELYVSSEKRIPYPESVAGYLKPGTGVWTIERLSAPSIEGLASARPVTVLESRDPGHLHLKDPFIYTPGDGGSAHLMFCHHPFGWTSSNSGYIKIDDLDPVPKGKSDSRAVFDFFPRGTTWDVAITRSTCVMAVPKLGAFSGIDARIVFYDGGECLRNLDEHSVAVRRPRGYSCEELGGAGYFTGSVPESIVRLSENFPLFVSPNGSGSSRYVSILERPAGWFATWQQSQADRSQPLVMNFLSREEVATLL